MREAKGSVARPALNKQTYIDAALEVIAEVGVEKLSMRNVAARLNVSPMAMYKHFPNKEELLVASLDAFISRADVIPDESLPWDDWVRQVGRGMYQALCQEMSWVPMLGSMRLGSQAVKVTEAFVSKLTATGFSVEQSLRAYFTVIQVVVGAVCLRSSLDYAGQDRPLNVPQLDSMLELEQIDIGLPLVIVALKAQLSDS